MFFLSLVHQRTYYINMEIIRDDDELIIEDNKPVYIEEEPKSNHKFINSLLVVIDFSLAIYLIYNIIVMFTK